MIQAQSQHSQIHYLVHPGGSLQGQVRVPGDKSISHRAIMLGSLANGVSSVSGFLEGEDALATLAAFRAMGVEIEGPTQGQLRIHGVGMHGLQAPNAPLDLGNSGTSMRLLAGLLAGQGFAATLTGDASLSLRPMRRVTEPLAQMGAHIQTHDGKPPLDIHPVDSLQGITYHLPMASAQVKSCLLLAGLYASGETCVVEPAPSRDHTERMLTGMGVSLQQDNGAIVLQGGQTLQPMQMVVPADLSSATFFMIGACIAEGSAITLTQVGVNPTRTGVIDILRAMGADISLSNLQHQAGEPVADITVRSAPLHGIDIPKHLVPLAIDEFPAIFIAAACASGETVLTGAEELRVKESDRIQVMADGLQRLGIQARPTEDGIVIQGGVMQGGCVESHGDHRIAMAFAMAALRASAPIEIRDCANVATSFPGFVALAQQAGLQIESVHAS